jgi:hypothetical protein
LKLETSAGRAAPPPHNCEKLLSRRRRRPHDGAPPFVTFVIGGNLSNSVVCMGDALDKRMPVNELFVTVAILDPAQRQLSTVSKFPEQRNQTAVDLGTQRVDRFAGSALEYQASGTGDLCQSNTGETLPVEKTKL